MNAEWLVVGPCGSCSSSGSLRSVAPGNVTSHETICSTHQNSFGKVCFCCLGRQEHHAALLSALYDHQHHRKEERGLMTLSQFWFIVSWTFWQCLWQQGEWLGRGILLFLNQGLTVYLHKNNCFWHRKWIKLYISTASWGNQFTSCKSYTVSKMRCIWHSKYLWKAAC